MNPPGAGGASLLSASFFFHSPAGFMMTCICVGFSQWMGRSTRGPFSLLLLLLLFLLNIILLIITDWSGPLKVTGLIEDVGPVEPLAVGKTPTKVNVWISSKGVVALLHYDLYFNCFVQVKGKKRFILYPPSTWKNLYLHPLHHPVRSFF